MTLPPTPIIVRTAAERRKEYVVCVGLLPVYLEHTNASVVGSRRRKRQLSQSPPPPIKITESMYSVHCARDDHTADSARRWLYDEVCGREHNETDKLLYCICHKPQSKKFTIAYFELDVCFLFFYFSIIDTLVVGAGRHRLRVRTAKLRQERWHRCVCRSNDLNYGTFSAMGMACRS